MKLINFPFIRQTYNYDCGAVALQGLLYYYGLEIREDKLIKFLKTNKEGTYIGNIKQLLEELNIKYKEGQLTVEDLIKNIDNKNPVLMTIQAWHYDDKAYQYNQNSLKDGHYVVCIGHSKKYFIFEDPSLLNIGYIPKEEFIKRWIDVDKYGKIVKNWGLTITDKEPEYKLTIAKRIY